MHLNMQQNTSPNCAKNTVHFISEYLVMYLHWEFGGQELALLPGTSSQQQYGQKKKEWKLSIPVVHRVKKPWVSLSTRTPFLQNPTGATGEESTREQLHKTSGFAVCFPSCTYSVVLAEIQPSSGPLVPPLRTYSWEQDTADLSCRTQRLAVISWCRKALHSPVLTMCVCVFGGGVRARIQLENKGTG